MKLGQDRNIRRRVSWRRQCYVWASRVILQENNCVVEGLFWLLKISETCTCCQNNFATELKRLSVGYGIQNMYRRYGYNFCSSEDKENREGKGGKCLKKENICWAKDKIKEKEKKESVKRRKNIWSMEAKEEEENISRRKIFGVQSRRTTENEKKEKSFREGKCIKGRKVTMWSQSY